MLTTALFRISPSGRAPRPALRALLRAARHARSLPGFRRWQTFRALDALDALFVLVDWESPESLRAALADPVLAGLRQEAPDWGFTVSPVETLPSTFDRRLARQAASSTLMRVSRSRDAKRAAMRDSDFALQTLAAPGSTRIYGGRAPESGWAACRIDFDTDDGMWHFQQSPVRRSWSAWAEQGLEEECWALNLPRLSYTPPTSRPCSPVPPPQNRSGLSVQFSVSEDHQEGRLWLQGTVDGRGSAWCERLCEILLGDGCRRLEVDVSGLTGISAEALGMLTRTARRLKERGGQFVLTDNEERVRRVTRSRHLETSVR